jgi:hypothetical protein
VRWSPRYIGRSRTRRRRAARRRRTVDPIGAPPVPRPADIVAAPVIAEIEGDDPDAERRARIEHGHASVLIVVVQIAAVEPTVIAFPVDIAPREIVETAVDSQQAVRGNAHDDGIVGARARPKVNFALGVGVASDGCGAEHGEQGGEQGERQSFHLTGRVTMPVMVCGAQA